ncbi:MAG: glycosyl hydrolase [Bryobacterales bacterium]|nr:glycosyl hydrolase [Bryobacterales bacterium]
MRLAFCVLSVAWAVYGQAIPYGELKYRLVGPPRGGRVTAVAGVTSQPNVYYFGATGGGVWKTTDGGRRWEPVTDKYLTTGSVGAIGVAESDPNVVYVGMGESPIRGNVSHGDGMYKSTDAGKSWTKIGLADTRHIARVRVHPSNPDLVYVAALGHVFGPNEERGVFRSSDGGKSWKQVLTRGPKAGAIDLILDPTNPRIVYAAFWEVYRKPWTLESGGPGSGLWKSMDGGDTWVDLSRKPGMPKGLMGKIGVTVSPVNPQRVWAIVEAEEGGVFRSDNGGDTWTRVNAQRDLRQRAWYYSRLYADPGSVDGLYVLNVAFYHSLDGGKTYSQIGTPHGDNHDLWVAPNDARRMVQGNDGGANVSFDGGRSWTAQNQPTAQFYRVTVDNEFPYNIYGAQQDNTTIRIKSRGATERDWYPVGGGESGWIAPHPKDADIVFAGSYGGLLTRYDIRTGQNRLVNVWPDNPMGHAPADLKYRFQWNFPILFSPHDANVLYTAGNMVFRSTNEGQSWEAISGDLTRNDKSKQTSSGGPITKDNTSVEYYGTVFTMAESPVKKGAIWTGSDDGLVQLTEDGRTWRNVTPKDMPEFVQINSLEASPHEAGTAYVAATMYKWDDFRPYLYRTSDYGRTWTRINNGIPDGAFTRVIREDPHRKGLLYAGTETGMYVSFNNGDKWEPLRLNLPVVPITDIVVQKREKDLVVATQGRSFYVLEDLGVLHQIHDGSAKGEAFLFTPEPGYRTAGGGGVGLWFYAKEAPKGEVALEIVDAAGRRVNRYVGGGAEEGGGRPRLAVKAGLNQFVWDLRHEDPVTFPGLVLWGGLPRGPKVSPGRYQAKLTPNGQTLTVPVEVRKDPRLTAISQADLDQQQALSLQVRDKLSETHRAIGRIRDTKKQLEEMTGRLDAANVEQKAVIDAAKALGEKLAAVERVLYQVKNQSAQDPLNYPIQLNNRLSFLLVTIQGAEAAPTRQSQLLYEELASAINGQLQVLKGLLDGELAGFNRMARERNVPAVIVKP